MIDLTSLSTIRALLERHGFHFSKAMGQNFIINPSVCPRMVELGGANPDVGCIEVGPGIGVLTMELAKRCKKVVSIELDRRLIPILDETLADCDNVTVINADIMYADIKRIISEHFQGMEVIVCANLPYYITSPVIMRLLEEKPGLKSITVMVQKEAAQRLCAPMPSREMGAVTVAVRYHSSPRPLFPVSAGSFYPAPKVDSSVIRLDVNDAPPVEVISEKMFFSLVKAAFSQRRKTLLNCVSSGLVIEKSHMAIILDNAGVAASRRAESLSIDEFAAIERELSLYSRQL